MILRLLIIALLAVTLSAKDFSFAQLRAQEKLAALQAFKTLYKKRKHIHGSMHSSLRYARSKSLHKNSLSFFQAKKRFSEDGQPLELSSAFVKGVISEEPALEELGNDTTTQNTPQTTPTADDGVTTTEVNVPQESGETPSVDTIEDSSEIRGSVTSPWSRR